MLDFIEKTKDYPINYLNTEDYNWEFCIYVFYQIAEQKSSMKDFYKLPDIIKDKIISFLDNPISHPSENTLATSSSGELHDLLIYWGSKKLFEFLYPNKKYPKPFSYVPTLEEFLN